MFAWLWKPSRCAFISRLAIASPNSQDYKSRVASACFRLRCMGIPLSHVIMPLKADHLAYSGNFLRAHGICGVSDTGLLETISGLAAPLCAGLQRDEWRRRCHKAM